MILSEKARSLFVHHALAAVVLEIARTGLFKVADKVPDFAQGEDVIDVSTIDAKAGAVGNQDFTFIANTAFSNTAGELLARTSGGNTIVEGDRDGDGNADFSILVVGVTGLTQGDFVL